MVTNLDTFGHFFTLCVPKNDFWRIQYFWINLTLTFVSLRPLKPQIYKIERKIRQQFAVYNVSKRLRQLMEEVVQRASVTAASKLCRPGSS